MKIKVIEKEILMILLNSGESFCFAISDIYALGKTYIHDDADGDKKRVAGIHMVMKSGNSVGLLRWSDVIPDAQTVFTFKEVESKMNKIYKEMKGVIENAI